MTLGKRSWGVHLNAAAAPGVFKGRTLFRFMDETGLRRWAATRDCQGRLPELLTRLIRAGKGHQAHLRFPSGDAVALHGWDGRCRVDGVHPGSDSGWEISAQAENIRHDPLTRNAGGEEA